MSTVASKYADALPMEDPYVSGKPYVPEASPFSFRSTSKTTHSSIAIDDIVDDHYDDIDDKGH